MVIEKFSYNNAYCFCNLKLKVTRPAGKMILECRRILWVFLVPIFLDFSFFQLVETLINDSILII